MTTEPNEFDNWDRDRNFVGLWGTYKAIPGQVIDLYYLNLIDNRAVSAANIAQGTCCRVTPYFILLVLAGLGIMRIFSTSWKECTSLADALISISPPFCCFWCGVPAAATHEPQFWLRYDFASGDKNPNDGHSDTFNQLFPFGHYYFGYMDQVGRQNIHDFNAQFSMNPQPWISFTGQYHRFYLANKRDYLYNAAGIGFIRDSSGQSGSHVGDEIDFSVNFHVARHHDILLGYSKLFTGTFIKNQRPGVSPDLFYAQYNFRF